MSLIPINYVSTIANVSAVLTLRIRDIRDTSRLPISKMYNRMIDNCPFSNYRENRVNIKLYDADPDMPGNGYAWSGHFPVGSYTVKDICHEIMINTHLNFKSMRQILLNRKD
ncbi:MAG: hypothetical protein IKR19_08705 [Acholeplasmatales bacterium]|nr:hypothetical protein [Acholeplasmatales bacterium]